eukprot:scaffold131389_cov27-Tisochrysis_lutea.AAC.2
MTCIAAAPAMNHVYAWPCSSCWLVACWCPRRPRHPTMRRRMGRSRHRPRPPSAGPRASCRTLERRAFSAG